MSVRRQFAVLTLLAVTTFAATTARAARVDLSQDRRNDQRQNVVEQQTLQQDVRASLFTTLPTNLQAAAALRSTAEPIAYRGPYRGWDGPGYRYGYWGAPRYYRSNVPYNAYDGGYPSYYYGPRVGVRVYPYGGNVYWGRGNMYW